MMRLVLGHGRTRIMGFSQSELIADDSTAIDHSHSRWAFPQSNRLHFRVFRRRDVASIEDGEEIRGECKSRSCAPIFFRVQ